mgnify:CR=1 FL=1
MVIELILCGVRLEIKMDCLGCILFSNVARHYVQICFAHLSHNEMHVMYPTSFYL